MAEHRSSGLVSHIGRVTKSVSLAQVWAVIALASVFVSVSLMLVQPNDYWWHVRAGQWIVENRALPTVDLFSFTRLGEPWAYQSWIMEIGFYLLHRSGGLPLVLFAQAIVMTGSYYLVLLSSRRVGPAGLRSASIATLVAAMVGMAAWNARPQTMSFLLFSATLWILLKADGLETRGAIRWLWMLIPIFVLWVNAHGGFVFGLGLIGASLLGNLHDWLRHRRQFPAVLAITVALCCVATLVSPLGFGIVDYVLGFVRHPITMSVNSEFRPPSVRTPDGLTFFGFVGMLVCSMIVSGRRPGSAASFGMLIFGLLALLSRRNIAWFGIAAAPTIAATVTSLDSKHHALQMGKPRGGPLNLALVLATSLGILFSLPWFRPYLPLTPQRRAYVSSDTPIAAVAWLKEQEDSMRVFHTDGYGSYMIWACPEFPVFIDTRFELYEEQQWEDLLSASAARYDWEDTLAAYGVDTLILRRAVQAPLIEAATADTDWQVAYEDDQTVILRLVNHQP